MIYIDSESAIRGSVRRLVVTRNDDGDVIDESYTEVIGEHWLDLQPLSHDERITADQLKVKATHKIYPELNYVPNVSINDFYRVDGRDYRIVEPWDFRALGYFRVWDGAFGLPPVDVVTTRQTRSFVFHGLGPGVYTFGSGVMASVPTFEEAPLILDSGTNDGGYYIDNKTESGFTIFDTGIGSTPEVSVYIQGLTVA